MKPSPESIAAVEQTAELLRSLGHEVREYKLAQPQPLLTFTPRWAAGIREDALAHQVGLEPRSLRMAAVGRRLGGRALRRSIEREPRLAERLNRVFNEHDLVLTPTTAAAPPPAEISNGAGAFRSFNDGTRYVCYTPTWNYVGQPAASIPAGFDTDGVPTAVQLAGPPTVTRRSSHSPPSSRPRDRGATIGRSPSQVRRPEPATAEKRLARSTSQ